MLFSGATFSKCLKQGFLALACGAWAVLDAAKLGVAACPVPRAACINACARGCAGGAGAPAGAALTESSRFAVCKRLCHSLANSSGMAAAAPAAAVTAEGGVAAVCGCLWWAVKKIFEGLKDLFFLLTACVRK